MAIRPDADFSAWFDEILPRVYRLVSRTTDDHAAAEDMAAEALARAYARWPAIRELPYRDGWVLRTAANLSVDVARRQARFPWGKLRSAQRDGDGTTLEDLVADRRTLAVALARLPARQREAVTLRYLGGLTLEETATTMHLGVETVRTHVTRGLAAMRKSLGSDRLEGLDAHA